MNTEDIKKNTDRSQTVRVVHCPLSACGQQAQQQHFAGTGATAPIPAHRRPGRNRTVGTGRTPGTWVIRDAHAPSSKQAGGQGNRAGRARGRATSARRGRGAQPACCGYTFSHAVWRYATPTRATPGPGHAPPKCCQVLNWRKYLKCAVCPSGGACNMRQHGRVAPPQPTCQAHVRHQIELG